MTDNSNNSVSSGSLAGIIAELDKSQVTAEAGKAPVNQQVKPGYNTPVVSKPAYKATVSEDDNLPPEAFYALGD